MKIKPEHYNHMSEAIRTIAGKPIIEKHRAAIIAEGKAKDIEMRLRWDCAYAAGLSGYIARHVYSYANDTHVDTALRAIIKSIED